MTIGDRIKNRREELKMSQEELVVILELISGIKVVRKKLKKE